MTTKYQQKEYRFDGPNFVLIATARHGDRCGNGHNTFSITADLYDRSDRIPGEVSERHATTGKRYWLGSCGCLHDKITRCLPRLTPLLKWHLCSTDGPLYYLDNATFWAKEGNLEHARNSAIWPEATLEQLQDVHALNARLPKLMAEFRAAVESLGFTY